MMIDIEDVLPGRVNIVLKEVQAEIKKYLATHNLTECDLYDINDRGELYEIIGICVPSDPKHIKDAWYLHGKELEEAYFEMKEGSNPLDHDGVTAIFCYLEKKVNEWFDQNAHQLFA